MLSDLWIKIELVLKVFKNVPSVGEAQVLREVAGDGPGLVLRGRGDRARPRPDVVEGDHLLRRAECGPRHSGGPHPESGGVWSPCPERTIHTAVIIVERTFPGTE